MRALVLSRQAPIEEAPRELKEVPDPEPDAGEVCIRVKAWGVRHTDLHEVEGDLPLRKQPAIPGHEIVGVVDKVGPDAWRLTFRPKTGPGVVLLLGTLRPTERRNAIGRRPDTPAPIVAGLSICPCPVMDHADMPPS